MVEAGAAESVAVVDLPYPHHLDDGDGVSLRLAVEADAEVLVSWLADPAVHRGWGGRPVALEEVRAKYVGRRAPAVVSYVVERDDVACGYLQAWRVDGRCGLDMFIAARAQGRGTGPRAAALLALQLDALGWRPLTVDPDSAAAEAAWARAGFEPDEVAAGGNAVITMTWRGATA